MQDILGKIVIGVTAFLMLSVVVDFYKYTLKKLYEMKKLKNRKFKPYNSKYKK